MIKPAFENVPIECWIHHGRVGIAQHTICLFHSKAGVGAELFDAAKELEAQGGSAQRVLTFGACSRTHAIAKLKLIVVPESDRLKVMNIRSDHDTATVEVSAQGLALLMEAIALWLAGAEDFGVSPRRSSLKLREFGVLDRESGELWFWGPGYNGP